MRWRNTLIAFICFLLLLGYIYFYEVTGNATAGSRLVDVSTDKICSVTLTSPEENVEISRLESDDGGFAVTVPLSWPADRFAASAVFEAVSDLTSNKSFPLETARAGEFGLKPPLRIVTIRTDDGHDPVMVEVGETNPAADFRYVKMSADSTIHLVSVYQVKDFMKTLFDLRRKDIFPNATAYQITAFSIEKSGDHEPVKLSMAGDKWRIDEPLSDRADNTEVTNFLHDIVALKAEAFVDRPGDDRTEYGLATPDMTVTLERGADKPALRIELGTVSGDRYFAVTDRADVLFEIHRTAVVDIITVNLDRLREHRDGEDHE